MLKAIVDRFEDNYAVLSFDDGQRLNFPKNQLPKDTKEGGVILLSATNQKELAQEILNEILSL